MSPAEVTERLVGMLNADPGVANLVVLRAGATRPAGDAVQFDLTRASANSVLKHLRDLGLSRHSPVILETADAALTDESRHQTWDPSFHGDQAPVWELVEARIRADAQYSPSFFLLLIFAGLIGASGILTNSQILVVGAMVVGPEYSAARSSSCC